MKKAEQKKHKKEWKPFRFTTTGLEIAWKPIALYQSQHDNKEKIKKIQITHVLDMESQY